ncbi:hypothetical protein NX029_26120 [Cytobacillus firmus]|nr:hypothetical protein [Cytobacillus firmus]
MAVKKKIPCPKCEGRGIIPQYFYNRKGICFLCWGAKYIYVKVPAGKSEQDVYKEMLKEHKPDFKKDPPKAEMPSHKNIKNPSYFPTANSEIKGTEGKQAEPDKPEAEEPEAELNETQKKAVQRVENLISIQKEAGLDTSENEKTLKDIKAGKYGNKAIQIGVKPDGKRNATVQEFETAKNGMHWRINGDASPEEIARVRVAMANAVKGSGEHGKGTFVTWSKTAKANQYMNAGDADNIIMRITRNSTDMTNTLYHELGHKWENDDSRDGQESSYWKKLKRLTGKYKPKNYPKAKGIPDSAIPEALKPYKERWEYVLDFKNYEAGQDFYREIFAEASSAYFEAKEGRPEHFDALRKAFPDLAAAVEEKYGAVPAGESSEPEVEPEEPKLISDEQEAKVRKQVRDATEKSTSSQVRAMVMALEKKKPSGNPSQDAMDEIILDEGKKILAEKVKSEAESGRSPLEIKTRADVRAEYGNRDLEESEGILLEWLNESIKRGASEVGKYRIAEMADIVREKGGNPEEIASITADKLPDDLSVVKKHYNNQRRMRHYVDGLIEHRKDAGAGELKKLREFIADKIPDAYAFKQMKLEEVDSALEKFQKKPVFEAYEKAGWTPELRERPVVKDLTKQMLDDAITELQKLADGGNEFAGKHVERLKLWAEDKRIPLVRKEFMDKWNPKDEDGYRNPDSQSMEHILMAMNTAMGEKMKAEQAGDKELAEMYADLMDDFKLIAERKAKKAEESKKMAKGPEADKKLAEKRKAIVDNITYKDTELGRKIKAMREKGVNSTEDARAIGRIVAERFEENQAKFGGVDYKKFAEDYKAFRDIAREVEQLEADSKKALQKAQDYRLTESNRKANHDLWKELNAKKRDMQNKLWDARVKVDEDNRKIEKVKSMAFMMTMNEIRDMGGQFNLALGDGADQAVIDRFQKDTSNYFPKEWIEASNETELVIAKLKGGRAYHAPEGNHSMKFNQDTGEWTAEVKRGQLALDANENTHNGSKSTFLHEMQHRMDVVNPNLNKLLRDFYVEKVTNSKGKVNRAKWLGKPYDRVEKYRETDGGWVDNYMGKNYAKMGYEDDVTANRAWEVATMAIEMIVYDSHHYSKRLEFNQRDVYEFMLGVYAGV